METPTSCTVLTVFGATAGIGKSTIATNLAAAIARDTTQSVCIIDLDTRFGDVATLLGVEPTVTIADLARRANLLDAPTFARALLPHESGTAVLAAPDHPRAWADVTAAQIQQVVAFARQQFDTVVLDTPGLFNDLVATALEAADRVLVVAGLDMTSTKDTAQLFDLLEADHYPLERLRLVINQIHPTRTIAPAGVAQIIGHEIFCAIPYDEQVPRANASGQPVVLAQPKSRAAKQLRALAHQLTSNGTEAPATSPGLWARIRA